MNIFHHKDLGNHLLQLCPKVAKHPVYNTHIYTSLRSTEKYGKIEVLKLKISEMFHTTAFLKHLRLLLLAKI